MRRDEPHFQEAVVGGKVLYQELGYVTNHHRIKRLQTTVCGVTSHSSAHSPDSIRLLLLGSLTQLQTDVGWGWLKGSLGQMFM